MKNRAVTVLLLMLGLLVVNEGNIFAQDDARLDGESFEFREFLNNPPVIHELVVSKEMPPLSPGREDRQPIRFFFVRWQSPEIFFAVVAPSLRDLTSPQGPIPDRVSYSAGPSRWWQLGSSTTNSFLARIWETAEPSDKRKNPVIGTVDGFRRVHLDHLLTMGIAYFPSGGVLWDGDRFAFTNQTKEATAHGELLRDEAGRVKTVLHTFSIPRVVDGKSRIQTFRHRMEYEYESGTELPHGFPSRMDRYVLRDNAPPFFNERITFYSVKLAAAPLEDAQLAFEPLVGGYPVFRWITKNDIEHSLEGGIWRPVQDPPPEENATVSPFMRVFVVVMLLAPAILLAIWKIGKQPGKRVEP